MFSRQNDAGSRASPTYYWEHLLLGVVLVLVSESKGLYSVLRKWNLVPAVALVLESKALYCCRETSDAVAKRRLFSKG